MTKGQFISLIFKKLDVTYQRKSKKLI